MCMALNSNALCRGRLKEKPEGVAQGMTCAGRRRVMGRKGWFAGGGGGRRGSESVCERAQDRTEALERAAFRPARICFCFWDFLSSFCPIALFLGDLCVCGLLFAGRCSFFYQRQHTCFVFGIGTPVYEVPIRVLQPVTCTRVALHKGQGHGAAWRVEVGGVHTQQEIRQDRTHNHTDEERKIVHDTPCLSHVCPLLACSNLLLLARKQGILHRGRRRRRCLELGFRRRHTRVLRQQDASCPATGGGYPQHVCLWVGSALLVSLCVALCCCACLFVLYKRAKRVWLGGGGEERVGRCCLCKTMLALTCTLPVFLDFTAQIFVLPHSCAQTHTDTGLLLSVLAYLAVRPHEHYCLLQSPRRTRETGVVVDSGAQQQTSVQGPCKVRRNPYVNRTCRVEHFGMLHLPLLLCFIVALCCCVLLFCFFFFEGAIAVVGVFCLSFFLLLATSCVKVVYLFVCFCFYSHVFRSQLGGLCATVVHPRFFCFVVVF